MSARIPQHDQEIATEIRCDLCHAKLADVKNRIRDGELELELECRRCKQRGGLVTITVKPAALAAPKPAAPAALTPEA
jgi:hypothetical protein